MKAEIQPNLSLHFGKVGTAAVVDVEKQVNYWRKGSDEDWQVACELVDLGRTRHGLFFAHLALEKMLKAHVCQATGNLAPKIHNLVRLAELAKLSMLTRQMATLGRFNQYQLEGRYPDSLPISIPKISAKAELDEAEELLDG